MPSIQKSMLDLAHELLVAKKKPVSFKDVWAYVSKRTDAKAESQIGRFYKDLTLDGRFVALGGNMWDLKTNYTFKQLYDDARGVFKDIEEGEEAAEENPFDEEDEEEAAEDREESEEGEKKPTKKKAAAEDEEA